MDLREQVYATFVKGDDDLKRVWSFVRSDFWFLDDASGPRRALGALNLLASAGTETFRLRSQRRSVGSLRRDCSRSSSP